MFQSNGSFGLIAHKFNAGCCRISVIFYTNYDMNYSVENLTIHLLDEILDLVWLVAGLKIGLKAQSFRRSSEESCYSITLYGASWGGSWVPLRWSVLDMFYQEETLEHTQDILETLRLVPGFHVSPLEELKEVFGEREVCVSLLWQPLPRWGNTYKEQNNKQATLDCSGVYKLQHSLWLDTVKHELNETE